MKMPSYVVFRPTRPGGDDAGGGDCTHDAAGVGGGACCRVPAKRLL
jgi:hypothetical protein